MRVGVVGLGTVGQTHLAALRALGIDRVFGADVSSAARQRAGDSGVECFADYRDLLALRGGLDGLVVATPPRTHRQIAQAALSAGAAVLCEKPLALTLEECEALAADAARSPRPFLVGFCHRHQAEVRALRELLDSNAFGRLVLVNIAFVHGLSEHGREWITHPADAGGGVLFDSGPHAIDLFRFLAGSVDEVHGLTAVLDSVGRVEDTTVACVRSGSVLGSLVLSWKTPPWRGLVEVVGSSGRARVEYVEERVTLRVERGRARARSTRLSELSGGDSRFVAQMRHFLACIRGEEPPCATVLDGTEATRTILRIYAQQLLARPSGLP
jgi:predicted dehydrogenase